MLDDAPSCSSQQARQHGPSDSAEEDPCAAAARRSSAAQAASAQTAEGRAVGLASDTAVGTGPSSQTPRKADIGQPGKLSNNAKAANSATLVKGAMLERSMGQALAEATIEVVLALLRSSQDAGQLSLQTLALLLLVCKPVSKLAGISCHEASVVLAIWISAVHQHQHRIVLATQF